MGGRKDERGRGRGSYPGFLGKGTKAAVLPPYSSSSLVFLSPPPHLPVTPKPFAPDRSPIILCFPFISSFPYLLQFVIYVVYLVPSLHISLKNNLRATHLLTFFIWFCLLHPQNSSPTYRATHNSHLTHYFHADYPLKLPHNKR